MAARPKRKYQTTSEQNALLEEFYRELDEEDELFLGNRFVGDENDTDTDYEIDNNEADIVLRIWKKNQPLILMLKI